jgi:hypothetical protein
MRTRLPPNALFEPVEKSKKRDCYPLEDKGITLGSFDLKIIYDREKTGFEEEREITIVIN